MKEVALSQSVNADIPGEVVPPGLELVVEIDPEQTLGSGLDLTKRIRNAGGGRRRREFFLLLLLVHAAGWADELASITLSGPGGSVTLDEDTDRLVTILPDFRNGQIRAILRDAAAAPHNMDATVSALPSDTVLERLTSRGIPDSEDWAP